MAWTRRKKTNGGKQEDPNKLTEITRRVNQLIEERKKKLLQKKKASGTE
jgi:hypothetical protein